MAEIPKRRSALSEVYRVGGFGAEGAGVSLSEHRPRAMLHLAGPPEDPGFRAVLRDGVGVALPSAPNRVATGGGASALWLAPGRWLIVSERHAPEELEHSLSSAFAGLSGAANDVTSGRTVIRIAGPKARDLLAKGCPLDLHPGYFGAGHCAQSLMGQINVLLHAVMGERIDLYVTRGFAASLWHFLTEGAAEFGYEVLEATTD